jgi:hypothetical protein
MAMSRFMQQGYRLGARVERTWRTPFCATILQPFAPIVPALSRVRCREMVLRKGRTERRMIWHIADELSRGERLANWLALAALLAIGIVC